MAIIASPLLNGQAPPVTPAEEAEPMLLQPFLGKVPLTDAINAFPTGKNSALVPLGELCRLLAFGIRVDVAQRRATGFFISEKRRFNLDLATGTVECERGLFKLQPGEALFQHQDIYVDAARLQAWFPVEVKVDLRAALLMIRAKEKLPIQEEWERERKYAGLGQGNINPDADDLKAGDYLATPYAFASMPFLDLSTYWNRGQYSGSKPPQASAVFCGDLLWMSATGYLVRDPSAQTSHNRLTLSREDPHGELLGPLKAKHLAVGSMLMPTAIPLVGSLPQGTGLTVENYPLAYRSKFSARTFRGLLLDGWTVEFFQNGALMSFQRSRPDGQYEFKDVPLRFGLNQFRLVFHGPLGETREESARIDIGSDQPPPGVLYYRALGFRPDSQVLPEMLADQARAADAVRHPAYLMEMDYGLSSTFAMNTSQTRVALPDGYHNYTVAGLSGFFSYLSAQISGAQDHGPSPASGLAAEGIVRTGLGYSSLTVRRSEYRRGFEKSDQSNVSSQQRALRSETAADLSMTFDLGKTPMGALYSHERDQFALGGSSSRDRLQLSLSFPTLNIAQSFFRVADTTAPGPTTLQSTTLISSYTDRFGLQGDLSFMHAGSSTALSSWGVLADRHTPGGLTLRGGLRGTSSSLKDTTLVAVVTRMSGAFGYGVDAQYSKTSGYTLGIRLQAFLGREPRTRRWISDAQPMASLGAVSALAYLDDNGNGRRDPGERVLEGTQFKVRESVVENRITDPKVVFRPQLAKSQDTLVQVDETTLEDPAQQCTVKGYVIVPRPGKVTQLDFPIGFFGEITGTTRIRKGNVTAEYGGLEIELLRGNGERVKRMRSAYDGFFEFRDLALGDYLLQVTAEEAARLQQKPPKPRVFHIDNSRNLFEGQDLTMEFPAPDPVPASTALPPAPAPVLPEPPRPTPTQGSTP